MRGPRPKEVQPTRSPAPPLGGSGAGRCGPAPCSSGLEWGRGSQSWVRCLPSALGEAPSAPPPRVSFRQAPEEGAIAPELVWLWGASSREQSRKWRWPGLGSATPDKDCNISGSVLPGRAVGMVGEAIYFTGIPIWVAQISDLGVCNWVLHRGRRSPCVW